MQYDELIEDIFRRHPSVQNAGFTSSSYKAGLKAMESFDTILGHPWKNFPCIHVAGTNGKGSVSSMLAVNIAAEKGGPIGLYTSPHLLDFRERIKIISDEGELHYEMIPKEDVMSFLSKYAKEICDLSFFEITTGMALWWFNKIGVKAAIIEVGLGGRLDSTNIISPVLSVISSIGLDHCAMLGSTRGEIAREKAGIFKPNKAALIWGKDPETMGVFIQQAEKIGCRLYFADELCNTIPHIEIDLHGDYQLPNIRTVLGALTILRIPFNPNAISRTSHISGLRGRWEIISTNPTIICDIGHNPQALEYNFKQLSNYHKKTHIVYGVMKDKDLNSIATKMPSDADYYLCAAETERALPVDELYIKLHQLRPDLKLHPCLADYDETSVKRALRLAKANSSADDIIYVGGSNFVVAEVLRNVRK